MSESIINIVRSIGQSHLLKYFKTLSQIEKKHLEDQITAIDLKTLQHQQALLKETLKSDIDALISRLDDYKNVGSDSDFEHGKKIIASGCIGCLVVAGGQGTRLKVDGPKGMCKVTLVKQKSLFQIISEKTLAAGKQAGRKLPLAIMTSPSNHVETVSYFESQNYFGLDPSQVTFFMQKQLPLLDRDGKMFLETKDTISKGPDGNGGALSEFYAQGIYDKWQAAGIKFVNFILIDNPLADPFDAELVGFGVRKASDIVIKATLRVDPKENVGLIVKKGGKPHVIEYSELKLEDREALDSSGHLQYQLANISLFLFKMDFIKQAFHENKKLPLHKAFKAAKYLNEKLETVQSDVPIAWKFEKFIFDLLQIARQVDVLVYPREECFAPLKNYKGSDSLETVPHAIEFKDRKILNEITKTEILHTPLEIDQCFYYPTSDILQEFKGRIISEGGYISVLGDKSIKFKEL